MTPNEQKAYEWENEFYHLTETMDGQFRPDLKKLIASQIAQARADERARIATEGLPVDVVIDSIILQAKSDERRRIGEEMNKIVASATEDFDGVYKKFPAKEAAIIIKNRMNNALSDILSLINKE